MNNLCARALLASITIAIGGCSRPANATAAWNVRFGPVLDGDLIVGRTMSERTVWIATAGDALVRIDLNGATYARNQMRPLAPGEHVWGLASSGPREMWTLVGRNVLAQVDETGLITRRIALAQPHVGLFGAGRELVYQVMSFHPPEDALSASPPGGTKRHVWGSMRTRALPLNRGSVAALNLVSCGATAGIYTPCWFPDQPAVTLTDGMGLSREVSLDGLPVTTPELLLASDNPRRPVRDAFVSVSNDIWVLGSGEPPKEDLSERPGGWLLARYDSYGRLFRRIQLAQPARLVLSAQDDRCLLLAWDGRVVEVRP